MTKLPSYIPLLLVLAVVLAAVATYGIVSSQPANGKYDRDGDGLIEIEYLEQLNAIRYDLNGDGVSDADSGEDAYAAAFPTSKNESICQTNCNGYELARSLDFHDAGSHASGTVNAKWTSGDGWMPIGVSTGFNATFDGNGHTIDNLYINRTTPINNPGRVGLFGFVGQYSYQRQSSVIRRIGLEDVNVVGVNNVGGLAGKNYGPITASYTTGTVSGSNYVGGLVGSNFGRISYTYSTCSISGEREVGGLAGETDSEIGGWIRGSYATGSVLGNSGVGGLAGRNEPTLIASYATGKVSGNRYTGGLVGVNFTAAINSYWNIDTSMQATGAGSNGGGIHTTSEGIEGKSTVELQSPTGYTGTYATWLLDLDNADGDFDQSTGADDIWDFGTSRQYPVLKVDFNGDGEPTWWEFGPQIGNRPRPTPSPTPTETPTPMPTNTPTPTATYTPTPVPTNTPTPELTPTEIPDSTHTPVSTPTPVPPANIATPPMQVITVVVTATPAPTPEATPAPPAPGGGGACGLPDGEVPLGAGIGSLLLLLAPLGMIWGLKLRGQGGRRGR